MLSQLPRQKGLVWAQSAPFGGPGGPWRARRTRFGHYCHWLLRLCWTHGYHTLWTNIGPLLYGMVCYLILLYGFTLNFISFYCIAMYCIVFDIIAVYCMSPHCILWYGMVLYFIWSYCTVSHCYVQLLQRAGELPRSASSHFDNDNVHFPGCLSSPPAAV